MSNDTRTAYLIVILDENGNRSHVGIYSERHPTMRFVDTSALVMEYTAPTYGEARKGIIDSLRHMYSMGGLRAWILRELGEQL